MQRSLATRVLNASIRRHHSHCATRAASVASSTAPQDFMSTATRFFYASAAASPVEGASSKVHKAGSSAGGSSSASAARATTGGSGESHAVRLLQREVEALTNELHQRDTIIAEMKKRMASLERQLEAQAMAAAAAAAPVSAATEAAACVHDDYPCTTVVVSTSAEFTEALDAHVADIAIARGAVIRLPLGTVVNHYKLAIYGPASCTAADRPVIETNFSVAGPKSTLTISNCDVKAATSAEPAITATNSAAVHLTRCTVRDGRDGVYLSGKATASLEQCDVRDNVRGVMETLRCEATMTGCRFENNLFHCVLLSPPGDVKARTTRATNDIVQGGNTFTGGRCDVALNYNPIRDEYDDLYVGGKCIKLTDEQRTAGLVDATW